MFGRLDCQLGSTRALCPTGFQAQLRAASEVHAGVLSLFKGEELLSSDSNKVGASQTWGLPKLGKPLTSKTFGSTPRLRCNTACCNSKNANGHLTLEFESSQLREFSPKRMVSRTGEAIWSTAHRTAEVSLGAAHKLGAVGVS